MADDIRTLLEELGSTADEIADFLRGQGCRGQRKRSYSCPVAVYLKRVTSRGVAIYPNSYEIWEGGVAVHLRNPSAVAAFVTAFDAGRYPSLDVDKA